MIYGIVGRIKRMPGTILREPRFYDYLAFYVGIPLLYGALATPFATRPMGVDDPGYIALVVYVCFRSIVFWVMTDLSCRCLGHGLARFRLPLWAILSIGFMLAGIVLYLVIQLVRLDTRIRNPEIAPFVDHEGAGWNFDYVITIASYAIPIYLIWIGTAYGYMRVFNVRLFSYAPRPENTPEVKPELQETGRDTGVRRERRLPAFLSESRLPVDAKVYVVKAEEHYIRAWTDSGTDLLRYRFKDAVNELQDEGGLQVHRSWWVRISGIDEFGSKGKKMELRIDQFGLKVPVSLSYKQALMHALELRGEQFNLTTKASSMS